MQRAFSLRGAILRLSSYTQTAAKFSKSRPQALMPRAVPTVAPHTHAKNMCTAAQSADPVKVEVVPGNLFLDDVQDVYTPQPSSDWAPPKHNAQRIQRRGKRFSAKDQAWVSVPEKRIVSSADTDTRGKVPVGLVVDEETRVVTRKSVDLEKVPVVDAQGNETGRFVSLDPRVFGQPMRRDLVHRVVTWQRAKIRQGTHRTKNVSEVSGSGKKPWRQKGTGRARAGHRRPPHWRGGAHAHARRPRDYSYSLPKRVRNKALRVALSAKALEGTLVVLDEETYTEHQTKNMAAFLNTSGIHTALIIDGLDYNENMLRASSNIRTCKMVTPHGANVYDIVRHEHLVLTEAGLADITHKALTTNRSRDLVGSSSDAAAHEEGPPAVTDGVEKGEDAAEESEQVDSK